MEDRFRVGMGVGDGGKFNIGCFYVVWAFFLVV